MSKYKIDSLKISNFKVFDDFDLNFKKSNLISFGGPNGYGKTTIFDAIELALTGDIKRFVQVDKSGGSSDNIVAKNISKPVGIKIVMSKGEKTITFNRTFHPESKKTTNKISNFNKLWNLELIENDKPQSITQSKLEEMLEEKDLYRYYNNFFYIQQEDTAHFLKENEKERLNLIAQLFDLKKENDELQKLQTLKLKINTIKTNIMQEQVSLSSGLSTQKKKEKVQYKNLLNMSSNVNETEWDKEQISFTENDTKDKYLNEVKKIKALIENKDEVVRYHQVNYFRQNIENIKALIMLYNFQSNIDEILNVGNEKRTIKKILDDLNKTDLLLDNNINLKMLHDKIKFDFKTFYEDVKSMKLLKDSLSQSDKTLRELINFRDNLVIKFKKSGLNKKDCPLCGHDWIEVDKLITSLDAKKTFLNNLLESETKNYNDKLALIKIKIQFLQRLIIKLLAEKYLISDQYFSYLSNNKDKIKLIDRYNKFLLTNQINIDDLIMKDLTVEVSSEMLDDISTKVIKLIENKIIFSQEFLIKEEEFSLLGTYSTYFGNKEKYIESLAISDIINKEKYIEMMYFKFNQDKHKRLSDISLELKSIDGLLGNISSLMTIYTKNISAHRKKMIKDIEIPFYIYSGKILHNIRGSKTSGVFIKDTIKGNNEKLNNIRFVANYQSDQDIINTTSSGQLAGIVIALTLTFNRVYASSIDSIMIDDPVQSMDDINMISLVELLRYDFKDKQIFISTHEDEIEKYILYKYMKHEQNVTRVDIMKKELHHKQFLV